MAGGRRIEGAGRAVSFGPNVADDDELRVCGDVRGKRVLELGLYGAVPNCISMVERGAARGLAVDPSLEAIQRGRQAAANLEVIVEFHHAEIADLGFITTGSIDLALCVHHIGYDTDFARIFRQVHRVLKPEAGFALALVHPMSAVFDGADPTARRRYGSTTPTIGEIAMGLQRANFSIEVVHELPPRNAPHAVAPVVLVIRANKLGS